MALILISFAFFVFTLVSSASVPSKYYSSSYRNSSKFIRLHLPNINLILSSPHAGSDMPNDLPNRTIGGCQTSDSNACTFYFNDTCSNGKRCPVTIVQDFADFDPFAERIVDELYDQYRLVPYTVIAKWNRMKIDFNREINEATFNHPKTIKAYEKYHNYLRNAIQKIERKFNGTGLLLDLHQHAQGNYTMVGIRLSGAQLNRNDFNMTSIESLIQSSCPDDRSECIRGNKSLGTFLEAEGLGIAYPSLNNPRPDNQTFYKGGYITNTYSSKINVIQTELSYVVRNEFDPKIYVRKYVRALLGFLKVNKLLQIRTKN